MKIIVLAHPKDDHAAPVQWALEQAGYQAACWSGVSWTEQEQASLLLDRMPGMNLGAYRIESGDVIWLRQPDQPAHDAAVSQAGGKSEASACAALFEELAHTLETLPIRCINRLSASCLVRNKAVQLHLAGASGLKVPATLLSNSPAAVRDFFGRNPDNAVCKAFASHVWQQPGSESFAVTETFCLSREQLPPDEVFTYAPAIYQQMVKKQFDVRVVLMGERIYSFALRTPENSLDWRRDAALRNLDVEAIAMPAPVESGLLRFAQKTGVSFGVLDFAVDLNGEWWFLEINEQGQFLWLEEFNPQARLQQKFCAFLTAPQGPVQSLSAQSLPTRPLEERQDLFPSLSEYQRSHPREEAPNIASASPESPFKSLEP
jgi:glutathione synthase/RimK-type ligase-like ATP-grasp enzyme